MAAPIAAQQNQLEFFQYLGGSSFEERQLNWDIFQTNHTELFDDESSVSPKVFKLVFDDHLLPVNDARTYIVQELSSVWGVFGVLGLDDDPGIQEKRNELRLTGEAAVIARNKYDELLKGVINITAGCVSRVNWKKHTKNNYQAELSVWLQEKQMRLKGLLSDNNNSAIASDLETAIACLEQGISALSKATSSIKAKTMGPTTIIKIKTPKIIIDTPMGNSPTHTDSTNDSSQSSKRPLNDVGEDNDGDGEKPASKKQKLPIPFGEWWGPKKSKLSCTDAFFDVSRRFKAYIANPPDPPGTRSHMLQMATYLKEALAAVNKRSSFNDLMLHGEWNFRDRSYRHVRGPTMIHAGAPESRIRTGMAGFRGANDFKQMLGGGLTKSEREVKDQYPGARGMLALAHACHVNDRVTLRGGGADVEEEEEEGLTGKVLKKIRHGTQLHFRDPSTLWEQLVEDVTYPAGVFQNRVQDGRPPMMDPNRVGKPMDGHKTVMSKIPDATEWEKIENEDDVSTMNSMLASYVPVIADAKKRVYDFIYNNEAIHADQPKMNEEGGLDERKRRYGNIRDRNFARPLGYAFRARMYQLFRVALTWKLYLLGRSTLWDLLTEEKELLEIWDKHEEIYMEWENFRWFELSNKYEIAELENRYDARELLRKVWENERQGIDDALMNLRQNPNYYAKAAKDLLATGRATSIPGSFVPPAFQSIDSGVTTRDSGRHLPDPADPAKASGEDDGANAASDNFNRWVSGSMDVAKILQKMGSGAKVGNDTNVNGAKANSTKVNGGMKTESSGDDEENIVIDAANANDTHKALEFLEATVSLYEKKLSEIIQQNDKLDNTDPGNVGLLQRNNIDIMAKQQVIWAFNTEIHNLKRSLDPLSKNSYGKGAQHKWELPQDEYYWRHTRPLPKKKRVPLGITSFGLGPMPGEHPMPENPTVLVGCPPDFGDDVEVDEESIEPAGNNLFGTSNPNIEVPKDWAGFLTSHRGSWARGGTSGTGLLSWDDWIESAYQALQNGTRDLEANFSNGSPYKAAGEDLRRHVQNAYGKRFESVKNHNALSWRKREMHRRAILEGFAAEVNAALVQKGLSPSFPRLGTLLAVSAKPYKNEKTGAAATTAKPVLEQLRGYLKKKNEAELQIRKFARLQKSGRPLSQRLQETVHAAKTAKKEHLASYKKLRSETDILTREKADLMEHEEETRLKAEIKAVEEIIDADISRQKGAQAETGAQQKELLTAAEIANDEAAVLETTSKAKKGASATGAPKQAKSPAAPKTPAARPKPEAKPDAGPEREELKQAREDLVEARAQFKFAAEKRAKAQRDEDAAKNAAASADDDKYLSQLVGYAEGVRATAETAYDSAVVRLRIAGRALRAQQEWERPAETAEGLRARHAALARDFDAWKDDYDWGGGARRETATTSLAGMNDQWILEVTALMHECFKTALGLNAGPRYWHSMYDYFWATQGSSLGRKRAIWLYALIADLNYRIGQQAVSGGGKILQPFIQTPAQPPTRWLRDSPSREDLIRRAELAATAGPIAAPAMQVFKKPPNLDPLVGSGGTKPTPWRGAAAAADGRTRREIKLRRQLQHQLRAQREEQDLLRSAVQAQDAALQEELQALHVTAAAPDSPAESVELTLEKLQMALGKSSPAKSARTPRAWPRTPSLASTRDDLPSASTSEFVPTDGSSTPTENESSSFLAPDTSGLFTPIGSTSDSLPAPQSALAPAAGDRVLTPPPPPPAADAHSIEEGGINDAWPDLKDLLQATWNARVAMETLGQKPGDTPLPGREFWPAPVRVATGRSQEYFCL
ncbi:hypothetical protein F4824DRAFT_513860 [Ustulina deusta]|nr:hypothetical protein F4824DRAFT_513860 [Ustulina deusta]